jgi:hypothetical protein
MSFVFVFSLCFNRKASCFSVGFGDQLSSLCLRWISGWATIAFIFVFPALRLPLAVLRHTFSSCVHCHHLVRPPQVGGFVVLSCRRVVCTWGDLSPGMGACGSRHLVRSWLVVVGDSWWPLFCSWGVLRDGTCPSRAASGGGLFSSNVSDNDGASCCCICLCVFSSFLCVSQCIFVIYKYLLDLFVKWGFKGCSCNICYTVLSSCFVRFVSDYRCRGDLYPLSVFVMPYGFV